MNWSAIGYSSRPLNDKDLTLQKLSTNIIVERFPKTILRRKQDKTKGMQVPGPLHRSKSGRSKRTTLNENNNETIEVQNEDSQG